MTVRKQGDPSRTYRVYYPTVWFTHVVLHIHDTSQQFSAFSDAISSKTWLQ